MSGIEIAGLVLGAFPLVVKTLTSYSEGCQKINGMFRYHKQLEGFSLELETEYTKFQNTCENLLQDLVPPLHEQQMVDPRSVSDGQALWRSPKLRHTLNEQLRERTVNSFLKNVEAMEEIITELRRTFPTEPDGNDGSGLMTTRTRLGKRQVKTIIKGIGFQVLEATRKDNMARVRQLNQDLHELVQRGGYSYADGTKGSKRQAAKAVRLYRRAREHAMGLFDALKEKIERCSCPPSSHDIGLRLEVRDVDMSGASQILQHYESDIREGGLHFRTFIAIQNPETGGDWREVDVELLEQDQYTIEVLEDYTNEASYEASSANILEESSTTRNNRDQFNSALLEPRIPLTSDEESRPHSPIRSMGKKLVRWASTPQTRFVGLTSEATNPISYTTETSSSASSTLVQQEIPSNISIRFSYCSKSQPDFSSSMKHSGPIDILCNSLQIHPPPSNSCYGHLICAQRMKFCLRYPHGDRVCPSTRHLGFTSLDALLVSQPSAFTYKSRLQLGLKLASSVLQLHSSEWLPRSWNAHDIVFFTTPDTGEVNISNPIVRKPKTCDLNRATGSPSPQVNYDPTLVSLGMVLIELHYGRRLEACGQSVESQIRQGRLSALGDYDCYDESARFAQAYQLVEELYEDAGFAYAEAVRRCIRGIDHHESSLDKDGYKEKAYSDIMCPLKTSWERFAIGR